MPVLQKEVSQKCGLFMKWSAGTCTRDWFSNREIIRYLPGAMYVQNKNKLVERHESRNLKIYIKKLNLLRRVLNLRYHSERCIKRNASFMILYPKGTILVRTTNFEDPRLS
jgi:hypothetical protein